MADQPVPAPPATTSSASSASPIPSMQSYLEEKARTPQRFSQITTKKDRLRRPPAHLTIREFIESNRNCDVDMKGHNRMLQVIKNMVQIATSPKSPFAVAAANFIFDRAYGKPKPSEEEIEAIGKGGIQLVYVSQPERDKDIPVRKELPESKPEFVEGEVVEDE